MFQKTQKYDMNKNNKKYLRLVNKVYRSGLSTQDKFYGLRLPIKIRGCQSSNLELLLLKQKKINNRFVDSFLAPSLLQAQKYTDIEEFSFKQHRDDIQKKKIGLPTKRERLIKTNVSDIVHHKSNTNTFSRNLLINYQKLLDNEKMLMFNEKPRIGQASINELYGPFFNNTRYPLGVGHYNDTRLDASFLKITKGHSKDNVKIGVIQKQQILKKFKQTFQKPHNIKIRLKKRNNVLRETESLILYKNYLQISPSGDQAIIAPFLKNERVKSLLSNQTVYALFGDSIKNVQHIELHSFKNRKSALYAILATLSILIPKWNRFFISPNIKLKNFIRGQSRRRQFKQVVSKTLTNTTSLGRSSMVDSLTYRKPAIRVFPLKIKRIAPTRSN